MTGEAAFCMKKLLTVIIRAANQDKKENDAAAYEQDIFCFVADFFHLSELLSLLPGEKGVIF